MVNQLETEKGRRFLEYINDQWELEWQKMLKLQKLSTWNSSDDLLRTTVTFKGNRIC